MIEVNPKRPAYLIINKSGNYEHLKRISLILKKTEQNSEIKIVWTEHHIKR